MRHENWSCPKCGNREFETGVFRATGGRFAKIFDVQNRKFSTVSCARCQFTEVYRADSSSLMNVFDFFTN
jgi:predicted nucleic-acid-binding Zn-ribbon protein